MQYTINELRIKLFQQVYDVYEVFKNYFGEKFVDLQGIPTDDDILNVFQCWDITESEYEDVYTGDDACWTGVKSHWASLKPHIIVWWPRVTITNEHNKSITIQDLYAKVEVSMEGKIPYEYHGFRLTRSTYNLLQFKSGYTHSHCPGFYLGGGSYTPEWEQPCLGTGPIKSTIMELKNTNDEVMWMLFCEELARYVTVESLSGGPYRRLEEVGSTGKLTDYAGYSSVNILNLGDFCSYRTEDIEAFKTWLKEFIVYYLQNGHLCFNYQDNIFKPGLSYFDYMIDISNSFIEWFNTTGSTEQSTVLFGKSILVKCFAANNKFYKVREGDNIDVSRYEGLHVLTFKDRNITLHIEVNPEEEPEETILLNHKLAMYILQNILKTINYRYINEHNNHSGAADKAAAPTYQTVIYL